MSGNIPFEIQTEIITKLPVHALLQFRTVSKAWKSFIYSSNFLIGFGVRPIMPCCLLIMYKQGFGESQCVCFDDNNVNSSPQVFPSLPTVICNTSLRFWNLVPIGTSHGLWCFSDSFKMAALWNPSIRKSVAIVIPCSSSQSETDKLVVGFGVNPATFDPTIIMISYPGHGHGSWNVSVFTLSSRYWKKLENEHLPRQSIRLKRSSQAVLGSFIYWVASERIFDSDGVASQKRYMIVSFDLVNHNFSVIDIPDRLSHNLSLKVRKPVQAALAYHEYLAEFYWKYKIPVPNENMLS
ncbi:F-box domain-containing protein [Artemisia annua]|uniref:F-box domain-containing protein n=1 Tax=Artemisia annua TaxID=35608 RepID=A0A2U1NUX4_ARTAN|nr:F-box domain-containing protein [Artemisia annua]